MRMLPSQFLPSSSFKLAGKLGCLGLLAGLGACSNFDSLRSPIFTGSTNQAQIINSAPAPYASPLGGSYVGAPTTVQGTPRRLPL